MKNNINTSYDNMKEYLTFGAKFDGKYQIPIVPSCKRFSKPKISVDISESLKMKSYSDFVNTNVNFYIDDCKFTKVWNSPDRYLTHLKAFHSVIMPDYSIATGDNGMAFPLNIYNKYRNHALAYYYTLNDITVVPNITITDEDNWDWCFDGYSKGGTVAVCTNSRIKNKSARAEFVKGYKVMLDRIEPVRVLIFGTVPEDISNDVEILNYLTRNQQINRGVIKIGNNN